jgi:hypothetical protein
VTDPEPQSLVETDDDRDPAMQRLQRDRKPGEIESGMMSGSDEGEISATERFQGDVTPEEALRVLDPEGKSTGQ